MWVFPENGAQTRGPCCPWSLGFCLVLLFLILNFAVWISRGGPFSAHRDSAGQTELLTPVTCLVVGVNDDFLVGTRPFNNCRGTPTQTSKTLCIPFLLPCRVRKSQHAHALGDVLVHLDAGEERVGTLSRCLQLPRSWVTSWILHHHTCCFPMPGLGRSFLSVWAFLPLFCKHIYGSREPPWGRVTRGFKQQNVDGHPVV